MRLIIEEYANKMKSSILNSFVKEKNGYRAHLTQLHMVHHLMKLQTIRNDKMWSSEIVMNALKDVPELDPPSLIIHDEQKTIKYDGRKGYTIILKAKNDHVKSIDIEGRRVLSDEEVKLYCLEQNIDQIIDGYARTQRIFQDTLVTVLDIQENNKPCTERTEKYRKNEILDTKHLD